MTNWKDITKEEFDRVYDMYPPNAWQKWMFKYFSTKSERKAFSPSWIVTAVLSVAFLTGFIGTIVNAPRAVIAFATYTLAAVLVLVCFNILFAGLTNNLRLRWIRKALGLTREEYMWVVNKYYP